MKDSLFWHHKKDESEFIKVDEIKGRLHESQGGFGDIHPWNRLVEVNEVYSGSIQEPL